MLGSCSLRRPRLGVTQVPPSTALSSESDIALGPSRPRARELSLLALSEPLSFWGLWRAALLVVALLLASGGARRHPCLESETRSLRHRHATVIWQKLPPLLPPPLVLQHAAGLRTALACVPCAAPSRPHPLLSAPPSKPCGLQHELSVSRSATVAATTSVQPLRVYPLVHEDPLARRGELSDVLQSSAGDFR